MQLSFAWEERDRVVWFTTQRNGLQLGPAKHHTPPNSLINSRTPNMSTLKTQIEGTVLVIRFQDDSIIDETRIEALGNQLNELANESDQEKFVLSFEGIEFMSSAMIGKLVHFGNMCNCLLYTSPSPRDRTRSRMPSSA